MIKINIRKLGMLCTLRIVWGLYNSSLY